MIDWNKPIQHVCGRDARLLGSYHSDTGVELKVIAVKGDRGESVINVKAKDGAGVVINKPFLHTAWLNVYDGDVAYRYKSRSDADYGAGGGRIACLRITFKEGDGLKGDEDRNAEAKALIQGIRSYLFGPGPADENLGPAYKCVLADLAKLEALL